MRDSYFETIIILIQFWSDLIVIFESEKHEENINFDIRMVKKIIFNDNAGYLQKITRLS